ncbi:MAG: MFS transporter [Chthoniobacterales bacterium]|nr:MAG: MFS transporter [Chthoniobacterales bacterium]
MTAAPEKTWFGQPRGLTILFLTEMWEFFSYYGMRTLLVYYMTKHLLFPQGKSSFIYGSYTATAYLMPIFGGIVADRWLGKRKAVIIGGTIMAIGHFMMAFEPLFYAALGAIALGNGLFVPSLPSQINDLYSADDPRRGRAYNIYYAGINLGGMLAPLICGTLGEVYGWHYGFGAAGVGMFVGLVVYLLGQGYLPQTSDRLPIPGEAVEEQKSGGRLALLLLAVGFAATIFRVAYEQIGNTIPIFTDVGVDRAVGRFEVPMTWFQALNPLLVIALTPALLLYWRNRERRKGTISEPRKMATGALILAAAYLLLAIVSSLAGANRANALWLVMFFVLLTIGELHTLPTGLGLFARLAPRRLGATTVASWFLTIFSGSLLAGAVGSLWSRISHSAFFLVLAGFAVGAALLLWIIERPVVEFEAARER